jgi:riboflavin transporter FmnP
MSSRIRTLILVGVFAALAYVVMGLIHIPVFGFLTYDPKDAIIGIAGFILGPLAACCISIIVAGIEMLTVSATGPIGFVMNAVASIAFVGTAAFIYRRKPSFPCAAAGLFLGGIVMTFVMVAMNYYLTPVYLGIPRAQVAAMLPPVLVPFNMIKASINSIFALLLYKPVMRGFSVVRLAQEK